MFSGTLDIWLSVIVTPKYPATNFPKVEGTFKAMFFL
uniref:Uncharacterized protein n=1 Tax=Anguilla anguilla TaxID=7936 RepID=A0A0E9WCD3_ANGAN